jgi:antibiotic biosynthesis monooxygenase (ABM) superfamily enzyme
MVRHRIRLQVRYGHFKEYLELSDKLNELARARGWAESTFWAPLVGASNEFVIETEYPDLATFQGEGEAFYTDPEAMKLIRAGIEHIVEGSVHDELLLPAPRIA